jgi:hypothetical protein
MWCVHRAIAAGLDYKNGSLILEHARGVTFPGELFTKTRFVSRIGFSSLPGAISEVTMDSEADRDPVYFLWDYRPEWSAMRAYATVRQVQKEIQY